MIKALSSLRGRLTLVVFLSAAPALGLLYKTGLELKTHATRNTEARTSTIANLVALEHRKVLASARQLMETLSQLPEVYNQSPSCNMIVSRIRERHPSVANVGAITPEGHPFCSAVPVPGNRNARSSTWFDAVVANRSYAVSGFHFGGVTGKPVLTMAYPSIDPADRLKAVVFVSLDLEWLNEFVTTIDLPQGTTLTAIDRKGTVLARVPDAEFWVGADHSDTPIIGTVVAGTNATVLQSTGLDGQSGLFAWRSLEGGSSLANAYVIVGIEDKYAYADVDKMVGRNLVGFFAVLMLALVVATWGSDVLVLKRLGVLLHAARELASGNLSIRTGLARRGEVGMLASAFDHMADALEKRIDENVKARRELQESRTMLESVLDTIPVRVYWKDRKLNYLGCNQLFAIDAGLESADQIKGKTDYELQWRDTAEFHRADDLDVMDSGIPKLGCELPQSGKDGSEIWLESSKIPLRDTSGAIIGVLGVYQDITARKQTESKLNHMAYHDGLTGLVNRREFEIRLHNLLDSVRGKQDQHALLYIDLDQFKIINDTCGHFAGDEMLKQVANLLSVSVRQHDTLARLGGDEFGIILEDCPSASALKISESILKNLQDFKFVWKKNTFAIGASIGLVIIDKSSPNMQELLTYADMACYAAKDYGRNRVHVYEQDDLELQKRHGEMQWIGRINEALEKEKFVLYYQPIVPLGNSDELPHYEILLRMTDDEGNIIQPAAFISAAERYSLMPRIDRWVITHTLDWLVNSRSRALEISRVFINISGTSLSDQTFLDFIRQKLDQLEISHDMVGFEITETSAIADFSNAEKFIREIRKLGCKVALDDFGAGMSSFSYLRSLPVDYIKIDGSFVGNMLKDHIDMAIVRSINEVGHVTNIRTIAEFVENAGIYSALRDMGIDYAQGYEIAPPRPLTVKTSERAITMK